MDTVTTSEFGECSAADRVHTIKLAMPFHLGDVNCYLIENSSGFILIDTGPANARQQLLTNLEMLGCIRGRLNLIILTHGDFDHTGNAAYLQKEYAVSVAMHANDIGMAESGDMFYNRKRPCCSCLIGLFTGSMFSRSDRFSPDILLTEEMNLSQFGFKGNIFNLPGHSLGSVVILLPDSGDLFCGDLVENLKGPVMGSIMDNKPMAAASIAQLDELKPGIDTIHPGHGSSFQWKGSSTILK